MNLSPLHYLWIIFTTCCSALQADPTSCPTPSDWQSIPLDSIDGVKLADCVYHDLIMLIGAGEVMVMDTNVDRQIKGDICFGMISDELKSRSKQDNFDLKDPALQFLIQTLRKNKYYLDLEKPSDLKKLLHYIEEGRWDYIGRRFVDRNMHYYTLIGLGLLSILWILWRRRKKIGSDQS
ncbi:MAG: LPXTG cell wall anchor domain-containing protein [Bacteroidota bacterium]